MKNGFIALIILQRGFKLREKLANSYNGQPLPSSIYLLPESPQVSGLHTFIRNKDTPRDEFIFYSKRLIRLVIEYALSLLPFKVIVSVITYFLNLVIITNIILFIFRQNCTIPIIYYNFLFRKLLLKPRKVTYIRVKDAPQIKYAVCLY